MNTFFRLLLSPFLIGVLLATLCCKNNPDLPYPAPPSELGPSFDRVRWQITNIVLDPAVDLDNDGTPDSDVTNRLLRPCNLDNTLVFESGGTVSISYGTDRCDDDDSTGTHPGTWTYNRATQKLRIVDGVDAADVQEWEVTEASARSLKVKTALTEEGKKSTIIMILKAA